MDGMLSQEEINALLGGMIKDKHKQFWHRFRTTD